MWERKIAAMGGIGRTHGWKIQDQLGKKNKRYAQAVLLLLVSFS